MIRFTETTSACQVTIPADLHAIDKADEHVSDFLSKGEIPVDLFATRILLREAVMNAVIHGSGKDPNKEVRITLQIQQDALCMTVEDDGPGFPRNEMPEAMDVLGDGGRGLALMDIYADEVTYNDKGNRVALRQRFAADDAKPLAAEASNGGHTV